MFDREDMELLVPLLYQLREGISISDGGPGGKQINTHAPFLESCEIAAEIDIRLAKCGRDRYLVEKNYCEGLSEDAIAREVGMDVWSVHKRINAVMSYISSGECPRWLDCEVCGQHGQCHKMKKGRKAKSYTDWLSHYSK